LFGIELDYAFFDVKESASMLTKDKQTRGTNDKSSSMNLRKKAFQNFDGNWRVTPTHVRILAISKLCEFGYRKESGNVSFSRGLEQIL
jgi:ribosome-associated toxin RatA of RatAB toxin-antitoxin module